MGRARTVNVDLPRNLGRDPERRLRYKRPDTWRYVSLNDVPEATAIVAAGVINEAFGHKPPRGERHRYADAFRRYDWTAADPAIRAIATAKLPDLFPGTEMSARARNPWAFARPSAAALMDGMRPIPKHEIGAPSGLKWVRDLFNSTKKNAGARSIEFGLTPEDVEALIVRSRGRCEVSGLPLSIDRYGDGKVVRRPWAPSIDRIESGRGYSPENCRLVCCAVNYAMSAWGEDVLVEIAKAIARRRIVRTESIGRN
jgi:hypothetical protein